MKIETYYDMKPIPQRYFDWVATTDNYDGLGSPIGYGRTQIEAIRDLLDRLEELDYE